MRNPKHTPGPWYALPGTGVRTRLSVYAGPHAITVAVMPHNDTDGRADAALIAAAPDLLAVLAAIVEEIDRRGLCLNDAPRLCAIDEGLIVQAMAALEKATGGAA